MTTSADNATLTPALFSSAAVSRETDEINKAVAALVAQAPDPWSMTAAEARAMRERGEGPFPVAPVSPRARDIEIDGPGGKISLHIIEPEGGKAAAKGVYLHIHGGGWVFGGAAQQDSLLERLADKCGLACISVEYRLSFGRQLLYASRSGPLFTTALRCTTGAQVLPRRCSMDSMGSMSVSHDRGPDSASRRSMDSRL